MVLDMSTYSVSLHSVSIRDVDNTTFNLGRRRQKICHLGLQQNKSYTDWGHKFQKHWPACWCSNHSFACTPEHTYSTWIYRHQVSTLLAYVHLTINTLLHSPVITSLDPSSFLRSLILLCSRIFLNVGDEQNQDCTLLQNFFYINSLPLGLMNMVFETLKLTASFLLSGPALNGPLAMTS